ncbi:MAG: FAD-dependent oxidoreductase [Chthonomonadales bacterium]
MAQYSADLIIVGSSLGGVAGALRAAEMGIRVLLLSTTRLIGGQFTSQGVCTPDENLWIETSGGTKSYLYFRHLIRQHYRGSTTLSEAGKSQEYLNIGDCWVSRLACEPLVAEGILRDMIAANPNITLLENVAITDYDVRINTITKLFGTVADAPAQFNASYFIDATETGDLLPLIGVEHSLGAESRQETGEPDAPARARPDWIQPFTMAFALEMRPKGEMHTITPPADYEALKQTQKYHILDGAMHGMFGDLGWWTYRRVIASVNFSDSRFAHDVAMINTASNDFRGGIIPSGDAGMDESSIAAARRASLGYVYWLQTECPRVDEPGKIGYPEFRLLTDFFGSGGDGVSPEPYIRESRRIKSMQTILEQDVVEKGSSGAVCNAVPRAKLFPDSCGIGHYWLDIHDGPSDEPCRFLETKPFQIPLGSLIPVRVTNLLAGCKNLGVTHLTNGCYRLHPIEWNVGESAGALAAFCVKRSVEPKGVLQTRELLEDYQRSIVQQGIPIFWWTDLPHSHPAFEAAQLLSTWGEWTADESLEFGPDVDHDGVSRGESAMDMYKLKGI